MGKCLENRIQRVFKSRKSLSFPSEASYNGIGRLAFGHIIKQIPENQSLYPLATRGIAIGQDGRLKRVSRKTHTRNG